MSAYKSITLATGNGSCELELIPEFGGVTNRLCLRAADGTEVEVIAGLASRQALQADNSFRGVPLFPFANRLDAGSYAYNDKSYQFVKNESVRNNALHGFLQELQPELSALDENEFEASANLRYCYDGSNKAYPFPVEVMITYRLSKTQGFAVEFEVTNKHSKTIPVGLGWHPYFQLGERVDFLSLQLPKVNCIEIDDRMLPTGKSLEFTEFESLTLIGERQLDHCFQLKPEYAGQQLSTTLWSERANIGIEVWQKDCGYIQLYIPPDRQSIAIEPVSCGINAFNTGEGLIHLRAGQTCSVEYGVRIV